MIPSVYVAGASREFVRSRHWMDELEKTGIRITHDWTKTVEKYGSCGAELSPAEKWFFARADLRGIDEAHVVWLLAPPVEIVTIGMWVELGYTLGTSTVKKTIVVSPPVSDRCIFATLPNVLEFQSDDEAFTFIQGYGG